MTPKICRSFIPRPAGEPQVQILPIKNSGTVITIKLSPPYLLRTRVATKSLVDLRLVAKWKNKQKCAAFRNKAKTSKKRSFFIGWGGRGDALRKLAGVQVFSQSRGKAAPLLRPLGVNRRFKSCQQKNSVKSEHGWGGRIWTCACKSQSLVPYHLATPQWKVAEAF